MIINHEYPEILSLLSESLNGSDSISLARSSRKSATYNARVARQRRFVSRKRQPSRRIKEGRFHLATVIFQSHSSRALLCARWQRDDGKRFIQVRPRCRPRFRAWLTPNRCVKRRQRRALSQRRIISLTIVLVYHRISRHAPFLCE